MTRPDSADQPAFDENDADFYDLEYFLSMEYRYLSGAHGSRVRNILSCIGSVQGSRCLDIGCGGGYFTNELHEMGACVTGIDYSRSAVYFARSRYPELDFRLQSAYDLGGFDDESFDLVALIDVLEHTSDHGKVLRGARRVLKRGARLVVSTDVEGGIWSYAPVARMVQKSLALSAEGRACRLIARVEERRRKYRNYHRSHVAPLSKVRLVELLQGSGFVVTCVRVYPLVAVPIRDLILRLMPVSWRGDHQCVVATKC